MDKYIVFKFHDVTRPTAMVKRLGSCEDLSVKFKIDILNNLITAIALLKNQVVLHEIQQLGYLNSNLMLRWDSPFKSHFTCYACHFYKSSKFDLTFGYLGVNMFIQCVTHFKYGNVCKI